MPDGFFPGTEGIQNLLQFFVRFFNPLDLRRAFPMNRIVIGGEIGNGKRRQMAFLISEASSFREKESLNPKRLQSESYLPDLEILDMAPNEKRNGALV